MMFGDVTRVLFGVALQPGAAATDGGPGGLADDLAARCARYRTPARSSVAPAPGLLAPWRCLTAAEVAGEALASRRFQSSGWAVRQDPTLPMRLRLHERSPGRIGHAAH